MPAFFCYFWAILPISAFSAFFCLFCPPRSQIPYFPGTEQGNEVQASCFKCILLFFPLYSGDIAYFGSKVPYLPILTTPESLLCPLCNLFTSVQRWRSMTRRLRSSQVVPANETLIGPNNRSPTRADFIWQWTPVSESLDQD